MDLFGFRPEVLAALTQTKEVKAQVRTVAYEVRDLARKRAPVGDPNDEKDLRRSLAVENVYDPETQRVEYHVGWRRDIGYHGWWVEAGTVNTPAQPHLRPAADEINRR